MAACCCYFQCALYILLPFYIGKVERKVRLASVEFLTGVDDGRFQFALAIEEVDDLNSLIAHLGEDANTKIFKLLDKINNLDTLDNILPSLFATQFDNIPLSSQSSGTVYHSIAFSYLTSIIPLQMGHFNKKTL